MVIGVNQGMGVLDGVVIIEGEGALFGVSHCDQWGLCCAVVRERHALPKDFEEDLLLLSQNMMPILSSAHVEAEST